MQFIAVAWKMVLEETYDPIIFIKLVASYILSRYGKRSNQNENTIEGEFIDIDEEEK